LRAALSSTSFVSRAKPVGIYLLVLILPNPKAISGFLPNSTTAICSDSFILLSDVFCVKFQQWHNPFFRSIHW
jgi:hypothetical protein